LEKKHLFRHIEQEKLDRSSNFPKAQPFEPHELKPITLQLLVEPTPLKNISQNGKIPK